MAQRLLLKRGIDENLDSLSLESGEPAFVLDSGKLYIGNGTEKVLINPELNWQSIVSGKPTTLSGYGITDALSVNSIIDGGYLDGE